MKLSPYHLRSGVKRFYRESRFSAYHAYCMARWSLAHGHDASWEEDIRKGAEHFRSQGYLILPDEIAPAAIDPIAAEVDKRCTDLEHQATRFRSFMTDLKAPSEFLPIDRLITPRMVRILQCFFRSDFKLLQATCYRTNSTEEQPANSWIWHSDNAPSRIFKIMIYLTDTTRTDGAIAFHPKPSSQALYPSFQDRYEVSHIERELNDPARYRYAEGKRGTVIFFDNNLIHRGTIPDPGTHRDAVVFFISPSHLPWRRHYEAKGRHTQENVSWRNPFFT